MRFIEELIETVRAEFFVAELQERARFVPEPPPGFVRRSDPNFYFLARKF